MGDAVDKIDVVPMIVPGHAQDNVARLADQRLNLPAMGHAAKTLVVVKIIIAVQRAAVQGYVCEDYRRQIGRRQIGRQPIQVRLSGHETLGVMEFTCRPAASTV